MIKQTKTIPIEGYCNYRECDSLINGTYELIQQVGDQKKHAKLVSVACEHSNSCSVSEDNCEIIRKAKQNFTW